MCLSVCLSVSVCLSIQPTSGAVQKVFQFPESAGEVLQAVVQVNVLLFQSVDGVLELVRRRRAEAPEPRRGPERHGGLREEQNRPVPQGHRSPNRTILPAWEGTSLCGVGRFKSSRVDGEGGYF